VQAAPETRRALLICRIQPGLDVQIAQRTISVTRLLQQRTRLVTGILL
jgi:hypothetical protein